MGGAIRPFLLNLKAPFKILISNNRYDVKGNIGELEFIVIIALLMSNVAFSIDALLPAFPQIREYFGLGHESNLHQIITMLFLGLGMGELVFGALSDAVGRKRIVVLGAVLFLIASILILISTSYLVLLIARILQGFGLASARAIVLAIIRDKYKGSKMARIISFISVIFLFVPMLAPILGKFILTAFDWHAIILFQMAFMIATIFWFITRIEETLPIERRANTSSGTLFIGFQRFLKSRGAVIYTLVTGLFEGVFIGYLGSSSMIFQNQYALVDEFPIIFGGLALSMGVFTLINGFLVKKIEMKKLVTNSIGITAIASIMYVGLYYSINPNYTTLVLFLSIPLGGTAVIFGNTSALALEKLNQQVGIASALFSFISMGVGVLTATVIGAFVIETVSPLFIGFAMASLISLVLIKLDA